ncbi:MAG: GNAT family N-acetyltransferase [bacterium]|nr:GNAT family N-acetyltransferase [bacterium]
MDVVIRNYDDGDLDSLNELLVDVYGITKKNVYNKTNIELVATISDEIVGYLTINRLYDSVLDCKYCYVNYVCVKSKYRNKGIATSLFNKTFEICKEEGISYVELTSNKSRVEAHQLYDKLGFNIRKTDVFRKEIL